MQKSMGPTHVHTGPHNKVGIRASVNHSDRHRGWRSRLQTRPSLALQLTAEPLKWNSITTASPAVIHQRQHNTLCVRASARVHTRMHVFTKTDCVNVAFHKVQDSWKCCSLCGISLTPLLSAKHMTAVVAALKAMVGRMGEENLSVLPSDLIPINTSGEWSVVCMCYHTAAGVRNLGNWAKLSHDRQTDRRGWIMSINTVLISLKHVVHTQIRSQMYAEEYCNKNTLLWWIYGRHKITILFCRFWTKSQHSVPGTLYLW